MELSELLKTAMQHGASDVHLKVGSTPVLRISGELVPLTSEPKLTQPDAIKIASAVMSPSQFESFKKKNDADVAYSLPGLGRFRCNLYVQRGTIGLVIRIIPFKTPTLEETNLPEVLKKIAMEERGLVLVTGATGSGKSTTLAAMVDYINMNKTRNIVTIEDPIEYLHRDKKSIISQREVGNDTESFSGALRSALRQDPDVILVGEMRDYETIQTALTASETGHLVLSTLHTVDATETVSRIISFFPPYQHNQVRFQLSSVLKGIISMRLMPRADGKGRVPAAEVLVATSTAKDCILDSDKTKQLPNVIAQGKIHYGMQTFDQSIFDLYKMGMINYEEALRAASNPDDFILKIKGISSTSEMTLEGHGETMLKGIEIERFQK